MIFHEGKLGLTYFGPQNPTNYEEILDFTMPPGVPNAQIDHEWKQHIESTEPVGIDTEKELIDPTSPPNIPSADLDPAQLVPHVSS